MAAPSTQAPSSQAPPSQTPSAPASKKKKGRRKLENGTMMKSERGFYKIESLLGAGGFGDVYKVYSVHDESQKFAMKTEYFDKHKRKLLNRLKVEMAVFADIQKCCSPLDKSHFVKMIDKGKTFELKFIVMEMVSHSLIDLRNNSKALTSAGTMVQIGRQTLQSIEALHIIGYVHRDIKPHNFAIGRPPNDAKIYMLDFGIARKYIDAEHRVRIPRVSVRFLGTVKYASRACHFEKEQSRRDDLEAWVYMMLEYFHKENIIWRRITDKKLIADKKVQLMETPSSISPALLTPKPFMKSIEYVSKLSFTCAPDYTVLHAHLNDCSKEMKVDENAPLDWQGKVVVMESNQRKKKKKAAEKLQNDDDTDERNEREGKNRRREERRRKMEEELAKVYKIMEEDKTPEQIKEEIRERLRKIRARERAKREERRKNEEERNRDEEDEESEDESEETYEPPKRASRTRNTKTKEDSRKMGGGRKKRSRNQEECDEEQPDRARGGRKKESKYRNRTSKNNNNTSRVEKNTPSKGQKSVSKKESPGPPLSSDSAQAPAPAPKAAAADDGGYSYLNEVQKEADAKEKNSPRPKKEDETQVQITKAGEGKDKALVSQVESKKNLTSVTSVKIP